MSVRPSKRAVMKALTSVMLEPTWEYREFGPDALERFHGTVEIDGPGLSDPVIARVHVVGESVGEARKNMIAFAKSFRGPG